jgi:drug/metabolite transporter (DMT)-like permease
VRGIVFMILAMLLFATMDGVSKHLAATYSIVQILWLRYVVFLGFVVALAARRGVFRSLRSRRPWLQSARSLLLVIENGAFVLAFFLLPLADGHAIGAVAPLMTTALAAMVLRERVNAARWLAVGLGFAGVLIIVRPGMGVFGWGAIAALGGAFLWAVYQVMVRMLAAQDSSETTALYSAIVGLAALTLVVPFFWIWPDSGWIWLLFVVIGLFGAAAHWFLILAFADAPASLLQPYSYSMMVWAVVVGFVGFGDFPDLATIAGALVIVAAGLYAAREAREKAN